MSTTILRRTRVGRAQWLVPAGLNLVSHTPILAGPLRVCANGREARR